MSKATPFPRIAATAWSRSLLCSAVVLAVAGSAGLTGGRAWAAASGADDPSAGSLPVRVSQAPASGGEFVGGDTLKLVFYERLDTEEDKWRGGNGRPSAPRGFHLRAELSGEYQIGEDGTLTLPMLGRFPAAGLTTDALQASLGRAFETLVERSGYVNVLSVEHQPVYIVGPVKNPGAFKYQPGMTILHAVALAGGLKQVSSEPWQRVEAERQFEALGKSLQRTKRFLLRTSVLRAERDGADPKPPAVIDLVGPRDAQALAHEEQFARSLIGASRKTQESALVMGLNDARSELAARTGRLTPFDETIRLRRERVQTIEQLVQRNSLSRPVLLQVQSELAEVEDRRQQATIDVEAARQKVTLAERELEKHRFETRVEMDKALSSAQREGSEAVDDTLGALDVLKSLATTDGRADAEERLTYEIVRRTAGTTRTLAVSETAPLQPGDLVRLRQRDPRDAKDLTVVSR